MHLTKGGCLAHSGKRRHAGNSILSGRRYILVGFVDVAVRGAQYSGLELHFQDHS